MKGTEESNKRGPAFAIPTAMLRGRSLPCTDTLLAAEMALKADFSGDFSRAEKPADPDTRITFAISFGDWQLLTWLLSFAFWRCGLFPVGFIPEKALQVSLVKFSLHNRRVGKLLLLFVAFLEDCNVLGI